MRNGSDVRRRLWVLFPLGLALVGCQNRCKTERLYLGDQISTGTITYGTTGPSDTFGCVDPSSQTKSCIQAPDTCASVSFISRASSGCTALDLEVRLDSFHSGRVIPLPSADVTVNAVLHDADLSSDAGVEKEPLALVEGNVSVTVSLNNFDARFNLTLARPNGDLVTIKDGRAALLNARWMDERFCD
jgi:hypothetical protein